MKDEDKNVKAFEGGMPWEDGWYGVTVPGASLETARPLYVPHPDGTMSTLRLTAAAEAALEQIDPYERDYTPLADTAAEEAVVELVRVTDGREVVREPLFVEPADAFAGALPETAERCWAEVRALDRELASTMEATAHWPRLPRGPSGLTVNGRLRGHTIGQCTRAGEILLAPCLARFPVPVLAATVAHELTHLTHFNHSPAFWRALTDLYPAWPDCDRTCLLRRI